MALPSPAVPEARVRPSGWWYLLVAMLWLGAIAFFASIVVTGVRLVDDGVSPIVESSPVSVPADGLTIYATQRPRAGGCDLTSQSGQVFHAEGLSFAFDATVSGRTVHAVATTPSGMPAGRYRVSCPGVDPQTPLWSGDRFPIVSLIVRLVLSVLLGLLGFAVLLLLIIRRHLSKTRIRNARMASAAGYPHEWPSQGGPGGPGGPPTHPYDQPPPFNDQPPSS